MSSEKEVMHMFVCPECDEGLEVNESMKEALIAKSCVICGSAVTTDAFTKMSPSNSV